MVGAAVVEEPALAWVELAVVDDLVMRLVVELGSELVFEVEGSLPDRHWK
jgi:hypothetical protein